MRIPSHSYRPIRRSGRIFSQRAAAISDFASTNAVVQTIRELIEKNVIERRHNRKKDGSFNDNTYTIEDIETSRTNDDFIADFFSGDDQCECVIIPLEKKNDCCVASTAADKSRVETPYSHRKAFHTYASDQSAIKFIYALCTSWGNGKLSESR